MDLNYRIPLNNFQPWKMSELQDDNISLTFESVEECEHFYNIYAREMGFSIRRRDKRCNGTGRVINRSWVCSKEGHREDKHFDLKERKKEPRGLSRVGCGAHLRIKFDSSTNKYVVTRFVQDHNHTLASAETVPFLRSQRCLDISNVAQAYALKEVGMRTQNVMDSMVQQAGSYKNVGFIEKESYNVLDTQCNREVNDGDSETALAYLCARQESDVNFYYRYDIDEHNHMTQLFWCDSTSRLDYERFGDTLVFDTTYRTNAYQKPFVVLVGVNNHMKTVIFGCALLTNEVIETYIWFLETFLHAMQGKKPISVITDGDRAMREAIVHVFPNTRHRLCSWNLMRNVKSNVNIPSVSNDFSKLMTKMCSILDFEAMWKAMVEKYVLQDNKWIAELYDKRALWAEAHLKEIFFAGMQSTRMCESMNSTLKTVLHKRIKLYKFVRLYDRAVHMVRHATLKEEFKTNDTEPVLQTPLKHLEKSATSIYTRNAFFMVREELKNESKYFVADKALSPSCSIYYLTKYSKPGSLWTVRIEESAVLSCSCMNFEHFGYPCRHMFTVMKVEHYKQIPAGLVLPRWTKDCLQKDDRYGKLIVDEEQNKMSKYAYLNSLCNNLCYYAIQSECGFSEAREEIMKVTARMQELCLKNPKTNVSLSCPINDVKTKNVSQKRCGYCKDVGHTKHDCSKKLSDNATFAEHLDVVDMNVASQSEEVITQEFNVNNYTSGKELNKSQAITTQQSETDSPCTASTSMEQI